VLLPYPLTPLRLSRISISAAKHILSEYPTVFLAISFSSKSVADRNFSGSHVLGTVKLKASKPIRSTAKSLFSTGKENCLRAPCFICVRVWPMRRLRQGLSKPLIQHGMD
jgi:hypothetical protein